MHEKKIEKILSQLSRIIDDAPNTPAEFDRLSGNWLALTRDEKYFYIIGDDVDAYNKVLEDLINKEKWRDKFSEKYINDVLRETMFEILEGGIEKAKKTFCKACQDIESFSIEQTIHIPLGGILMYDIEEIFLGKVQIKRVTESALQEILEAINNITKLTSHSPEEQEYFIQENNRILPEVFLGRVCSVYRVVAEPRRAIELAEQETQRALDLLRYSIPAVSKDKCRVRIDFSSQVSLSFQPSLALSAVSFWQDRKLLNNSYELSKSNLKVLEKLRIFELSEILSKPYEQVNEFEKVLLRGVHWFASSQTQVERENEFLNLTTCLEVFFTPEGGDPISNSIAESLAFILGKDLVERKRLKKRVKELYGLRSKISHGSHSSVLDKDITDLKSIATSLLAKMTERSKDFSSRNDLMDWLETQKLS